MKRIIISICVISLAGLACLAEVPTLTPAPTETQASTQTPAILPSADPTLVQTTIVVITDTNVRECANTDAEIVTVLAEGSTVTAVCNGDWCRVSDGWFCLPAAIGTGGCE